MRLIDLANKIDKSKKNESFVNITNLNKEFDCIFDRIEQDRFKAYWIGDWYCSDFWVGWRMYFFDDLPVAISSQINRNGNEEFEWFSKDVALKVRDYLFSSMPQKDDYLNLKICDINGYIGENYQEIWLKIEEYKMNKKSR